MAETTENSFGWLIENGFASREDYLKKLKVIRIAINEAVKNGWLIEAALSSNECIPGSPHHYHSFIVKEGIQLALDVAIRRFVDIESNTSGNTYSDITEIKLGHPCALLLVGVRNKELDYVIASSQVENLAFRIN